MPFVAQKGISTVKKLKRAGFKPPREAARSLNFSRFVGNFWERESAPAELKLDRQRAEIQTISGDVHRRTWLPFYGLFSMCEARSHLIHLVAHLNLVICAKRLV